MTLADELGSVCPVRDAGADDAVDGVLPQVVARPASTEETSALLRACSGRGLAVVVRGNGSKLSWGSPPERVDVVLETGAMDALVEHSRGDLVATAGAGMPLARLQQQVGEAGHQLVVDDLAAGSTLGGLVATNLAGPRRMWVGAPRDLVLGMRLVRADGTVAKAGGKVVKNVAGYDLSKLLTGSFGTLAVVTEVTVRLHPVPPASHWVGGAVPSDRLPGVLAALVASQLVPHAVEVHATPGADPSVVALVSGTEAGAAARAEALRAELGPGASVEAAPPAWWGHLPGRRDGLDTDGLDAAGAAASPPARTVLLKTTSRLSGIPALVEVATAHGATVTGSAGTGVLWAALPARTPQEVADAVDAVRRTSVDLGGSTVVLEAGPQARSAVDTWGPVPAVDLMRRVKDEFDPTRILAPGRFVGGL
ncbi:FAD-binding oxidoreductase [Ornithinimicrobium pekingense]|uniref:Glycolate oxidase n=1 Tax=Ornithinimicrobium pekingense TaxID=384677 RepID=A0ABQ2F644_9MICO|nr:FAD-binding oxidoreductase [Ornithinimicrobium pekingense]GGK61790.1 glycolate oxidase [Ornithinimicrobium pekingense]